MVPLFILNYKSQKRIIKNILVISLRFYLYWITFYPLLRIGLPLFALLSIPTAYCVGNFKVKPIFHNLIIIMIFVFCIVSITNSFLKVKVRLPLLSGINNNISYISSLNNNYHSESILAIDYINKNTPDDSKILFWPNNGFYLERDYIYALGFIVTMADSKKIYDKKTLVNE